MGLSAQKRSKMSDVKIKVIDSDKLVKAINEGSYDVNLSAVMALGAVVLDTDMINRLPSAQPDVPGICCVDTPSADVDLENYSDKLWKAAYERGRREAVVDVADNVVDRVFRDLNISCAYSMPSFWCHDRTDYAVIPTRYHKGYQKALEDAEKKIREALSEIAQGDKE